MDCWCRCRYYNISYFFYLNRFYFLKFWESKKWNKRKIIYLYHYVVMKECSVFFRWYAIYTIFTKSLSKRKGWILCVDINNQFKQKKRVCEKEIECMCVCRNTPNQNQQQKNYVKESKLKTTTTQEWKQKKKPEYYIRHLPRPMTREIDVDGDDEYIHKKNTTYTHYKQYTIWNVSERKIKIIETRTKCMHVCMLELNFIQRAMLLLLLLLYILFYMQFDCWLCYSS